jgi:hypothetical protein
MWMQESKLKLPPETVTPHQREGFRYVTNNGTALIEVVDGEDHAVWKAPTKMLDWALSLYPVHLKKMQPIESDEQREIREMKRQVKQMPPAERTAFEQGIAELEAVEATRPQPPQRYMLIKYQGGEAVPVHHLFLEVGRGDEVVAIDNDYTNFTTATIRIAASVVSSQGVAVAKGDYPLTYREDVTVPNLQILHSDESQKAFEERMLQIKMTPHGDIKESSPKVLPNATWRTGVRGGVQDCGKSDPLTAEEVIGSGLQGAEVRPVDEANELKRQWAAPRRAWGTRWS